MSPRAACRLETLGFEQVYDYAAGKIDWLAHGLPTEGEEAGAVRAGSLARADVVTCGLEQRIGEVRGLVEESPYGFALVTSGDGCVLGRLRRAALEGDPDAIAGEVMEAGPSTIRPHITAAEVVERLRKQDLQFAIVTDPEGKLIGVVRRRDAEQG